MPGGAEGGVLPRPASGAAAFGVDEADGGEAGVAADDAYDGVARDRAAAQGAEAAGDARGRKPLLRPGADLVDFFGVGGGHVSFHRLRKAWACEGSVGAKRQGSAARPHVRSAEGLGQTAPGAAPVSRRSAASAAVRVSPDTARPMARRTG